MYTLHYEPHAEKLVKGVWFGYEVAEYASSLNWMEKS